MTASSLFGETVSFLALGRQFLSLSSSGTLMNLSSFCNPVVFWALSMTAFSFGETVSFYAMDLVVFGVHFFMNLVIHLGGP